MRRRAERGRPAARADPSGVAVFQSWRRGWATAVRRSGAGLHLATSPHACELAAPGDAGRTLRHRLPGNVLGLRAAGKVLMAHACARCHGPHHIRETPHGLPRHHSLPCPRRPEANRAFSRLHPPRALEPRQRPIERLQRHVPAGEAAGVGTLAWLGSHLRFHTHRAIRCDRSAIRSRFGRAAGRLPCRCSRRPCGS